MKKKKDLYIAFIAVGIVLYGLCAAFAFIAGETEAGLGWMCCTMVQCTLLLSETGSRDLKEALEAEMEYAKETAAIANDATKLADDSLKNVDKMIKMNEELLADNKDLLTIIEGMQEYVTEEGYEEINAKLSGTRHLFKKVDGKYELYSWVK